MELACFCACTAAGTVLRLCGNELDTALDQAGGTNVCGTRDTPCPIYRGPRPDVAVPQGCAVSAVWDDAQQRFRLATLCDRRPQQGGDQGYGDQGYGDDGLTGQGIQ